jgi:adenylate cyclase
VLPFVNLSGDPEQKYFSDGLTIEIITELSRFQELSVVPRNSAFKHDGSSIDIRTTGATLGVRYVLDGGVLKVGDKIRVTARLSDANDGRQLWGDSYTRDLTASDFFSLQDELTLQVVNAIAGGSGVIVRAELAEARRKPPASLDSYDCVLRCYEYLEIHSEANHLAARDCMERVVDADPDYADARAWLAYLYGEEYHHRRNERTAQYDALDRALEMAEEAVRLDSASQLAHGHLALVHLFRGEYERGKSEGRKAIDLNPNNAEWLGIIGLFLVQQEDFEHGLPMARKAIELTPLPPPWLNLAIFHDHYHHGRFEAALIEANRVDLAGDDFREPLFVAATYGQLGRPDDARRALDKLYALWPRPVSDMRRELIERQAYSPGLTDRLLEGLRKAGFAEPPRAGE